MYYLITVTDNNSGCIVVLFFYFLFSIVCVPIGINLIVMKESGVFDSLTTKWKMGLVVWIDGDASEERRCSFVVLSKSGCFVDTIS